MHDGNFFWRERTAALAFSTTYFKFILVFNLELCTPLLCTLRAQRAALHMIKLLSYRGVLCGIYSKAKSGGGED